MYLAKTTGKLCKKLRCQWVWKGCFFSTRLARIIPQLVNTVFLLLCLFRILRNELQLLDLSAVVKPIVTYLIITEEEMCAAHHWEEPCELAMSKKHIHFHHRQLHMNKVLMVFSVRIVAIFLVHFCMWRKLFVCQYGSSFSAIFINFLR